MRAARSRSFFLILFALCRGLFAPLLEAASSNAPDTNDAPLPIIRSMGQFWAIPPENKNQPHHADLEISSTYYDPDWRLLWGVDASGPDFLPLETTTARLVSGHRFRVSGRFIPSQGISLATADITIVSGPSFPAPVNANGDFANGSRFNGQFVSVDAYVNAQREVSSVHLFLDLAIEGLPVRTHVLIKENAPLPQIVGAFIRVSGVYSVNSVDRSAPPTLWIPTLEHLEVIGWLDHDARFQRPAVPIDAVASSPPDSPVRVLGTVESQIPGQSLLLRDGTGQLKVETGMTAVLTAGTTVEVLGYPTVRGLDTVLRESLFRIPSDASDAVRPATDRGLSVLRLAEQVRRLQPAEAHRNYPVRLRGVVAWTRPGARQFYLTDSSGTVRVTLPPSHKEPIDLAQGFEIVGRTTLDGFAPSVVAETLAPLGALTRPEPRRITLEQAMTGVDESQWVSLTGYVRALQRTANATLLSLTTSAGGFTAVLPPGNYAALEGAVVELFGICRAVTDSRRQLTGVELWVADESDIRIEEPQPTDPFALPPRAISSLRQFNTLDSLNHRVHVTGIVLHHEPGVYLHLHADEQSLLVLSRDDAPLTPGDRVDVVGFPGRQGERFVLREAIYRRNAFAGEPPPLPLDSLDLPPAQLDGRLVRVIAHITSASLRPRGARLVGEVDGTLFEALLPQRFNELPETWAPGSRVALTGVYVTQFDQNAQPRGFQLQLRTPADVALLASPPWWNATRARNIAGALALGIALGVAWIVALRRRVSHQTNQIREQLEQSSRLESALARSSKLESLGVLAGGIAHDFNNLLTVIMGNVSLVLSDRRVAGEDEQFLRETERAALRARDLTQQLLTFAKGGSPVRAAVLLPDIVREAAGFALHGSKVRPHFDFAPRLRAAHVDRGQISQVVHNIVINAVQAMPTGGTLDILLRNEQVTADTPLPVAPGAYLALTIRDTGCGISPAHLSQIFDPYFTTKQQGSGLGLATVHSIVKKHQGHIDVTSELGHGTTFRIWLPAAEQDAAGEIQAPGTDTRIAGRALLMDDEPAVRALGSAMLRRLGLEVVAVPDGRAAIEAYTVARRSGRPFSLVLVDLTVPGGMGGNEAVAELRRIDPDVRAIVCSGYSNDPVMSQYQENGFRARVPKPYQLDELARAVAAALADRPSPVM